MATITGPKKGTTNKKLEKNYYRKNSTQLFLATFNVSDKRTTQRNDSLPLKVSSSKSKVSSAAGVTSLPGLASTSLLTMDAGKNEYYYV